MKTRQEIIQWLKTQKFYGKFVGNYNRRVQFRNTVDVYVKRASPENVISCAFVWHDTKEGNDYWHQANNRFLKWLKS